MDGLLQIAIGILAALRQTRQTATSTKEYEYYEVKSYVHAAKLHHSMEILFSFLLSL